MVQQYDTTTTSTGTGNNNVGHGGGPLSLLYTLTYHNQRANIKIRNKHTIRGIVTAYIFGFDKHFNSRIKVRMYPYSTRPMVEWLL